MSLGPNDDLSAFSMADLFRVEVDTQAQILSTGLVEVESSPDPAPLLEQLMRAAHSLKGAARIVNYDGAVRIAHRMEDWLVRAQSGEVKITPQRTDDLLHAVDMLTRIAQVGENEIKQWDAEHESEVATCIARLQSDEPDNAPLKQALPVAAPPTPEVIQQAVPAGEAPAAPTAPDRHPLAETNRALRISSENLNHLLGLAGEALLASRWMATFAVDLIQLKRLQQDVLSAADEIRYAHLENDGNVAQKEVPATLQLSVTKSHEFLLERMEQFDVFQRTFSQLSNRLYHQVLDSRMRPFGDVVEGFRRMVRDVARSLEKEVKLELVGLNTPIDRDILDRLEAPLSHLLRNSLDHGIETPEERVAAGKPCGGIIKVEARHSSGMLSIQIADDGRGVDYDELRAAVVSRKLAAEDLAQRLSEAELLEFLFLPGFTTKSAVSEISGRGVGLDAVQAMAREVGGSVRISSIPNGGTQFTLLLPLTLSVMRTLVVQISGEPYAFPLARVHSVTSLGLTDIAEVEGRQHFLHHGSHVGIVVAQQALGLEVAPRKSGELPTVVLEDRGKLFGIVVDEFLDERELVVLPLDPRLGKITNISAAALLPDHSPVLIFDTEDLIRTIEKLVTAERPAVVNALTTDSESRQKRVLVVDDSLTVRELERKLLSALGYHVDVAVDGMEGWNAVRLGRYDIVVSDVDMPRMDGIELVTMIRKDVRLKTLPVVVVSYKDSPEDRQRGLEAGADYYLTKSSFQDETFAEAVRDLIGAGTQ